MYVPQKARGKTRADQSVIEQDAAGTVLRYYATSKQAPERLGIATSNVLYMCQKAKDKQTQGAAVCTCLQA